MTKEEALYTFWSSFGLAAYESGSVPTGSDAPAFPYITYDLAVGNYGDTIPLSGSLWYRSDSLTGIVRKAGEIAQRIGIGGIKLPCDKGHIHLYMGVPWAQSMGDPEDSAVKRMYLNLTARFNTIP